MSRRLYTTGAQLLARAQEKGVPLSAVVLEQESLLAEVPPEELRARMALHLRVMKEAVERGSKEGVRSRSGLTSGLARQVEEFRLRGGRLLGGILDRVAVAALAVAEVNAAMGKIVAAPTAGSCGVLPGTLLPVAEEVGATEEQVVNALFTAAGIGQVVAEQVEISGAAGGCQAEMGVASAMAAAAAVELSGGTPEEALHAAAAALQNLLGLVCDPVAGLVEVPCIQRNALGAANALLCADLARAGMKNLIPLDEVIQALKEIGRLLPCELKETALGGLAATPTGRRIAETFGGSEAL